MTIGNNMEDENNNNAPGRGQGDHAPPRGDPAPPVESHGGARPRPRTTSNRPAELGAPSTSSNSNFPRSAMVFCSSCNQRNRADAKCFECDTYLCPRCFHLHTRNRNYQHHHVYNFNFFGNRITPLPPLSLRDAEAPDPSGVSIRELPGDQPANSTELADDESNGARSRVVGAGRRRSPSPNVAAILGEEIFATVTEVIQSTLSSAMSVNSFPSCTTSPGSSLEMSGAMMQLPTTCSRAVTPTNQYDSALVVFGDRRLSPQRDPAINFTQALCHGDFPHCLIHHLEFRFYCQDCFLPLCTLCTRDDHMEHHLIDIIEASKKARHYSRELQMEVREMNLNLRSALDNMQRMCESIDYKAHQTAIDVKCTMRRFIAALEARQDELLHRIEQARVVKLKLVKFQMDNIRSHYSRLSLVSDILTEPINFNNVIDNMLANYRVFNEVKQIRYLGKNIFPCEDDDIKYVIPDSLAHLRNLGNLGILGISCAPMQSSFLLGRRPLLYLSDPVISPENPLPAAQARPILGCKDVVCIRDFGKVPKLTWGKAGPQKGELCRPWGITINRLGQLIIADRSNNRIQVFDSTGKYLFHFGSHGSEPGQFERPSSVATNPNDDMVVADKDNHRIQVFNRHGEFLFTFGEKGSKIGQFLYPWDVACDIYGHIAVSDARNHRVQLFHWNGVFIKMWGCENTPRIFDAPRGVTFDPMGNILMTDFNLHRVVYIERGTGKIRLIGREGKERGQFNRPQGICCDDRGWFVVADSRNYRFQVFNNKGEFMWMVGQEGKKEPGEFDRPCDVCLDPEGHIHVMDFGNDRIQVF